MPQQSEQLDLDLIRSYAKNSLYFFAKGILKFSWLVPHIHGDVCATLSDATQRRKLYVLPRGWLKTTICSIAYPIWRAVHDPNIRILLAQNNQTNARSKLKVIRQQFESNSLLRALYPSLLPGSDSTWSADSLCLSRSEFFPESTFECIGVRGQATSRHYNIIIEDDTVAPDFDELGDEMLAPSHDDVRKAISWHKLALPLLTNVQTDEILIVGTRWYEYDLISHIMQHESHYIVTSRSCRENEDGKADPRGSVTYPERFGEEVLDEFESSLGPYFFSTLMLNMPVRVGDMLFKSEWFKEYTEVPPRQSLAVWTTVDPATDPELSTSRADTLDYSVVMTCGKDLVTGFIYVLDYFRERCSPGEHVAAIFNHVTTWRPIEVGYESVAYQKSIEYWIKEMMRQQSQYFILRQIKRTGHKSKETHIMGLHPIAASGTIHIRPWMSALLTEFLAFPRGAHDDLIDAMAMQTQMWKRTMSEKERHLISARNDPFSVEGIILELQDRAKSANKHSLVFNPLDQTSVLRLDPFSISLSREAG